MVFARMMAERKIPYLELPRPVTLAAVRVHGSAYFDAQNDSTYPRPEGSGEGHQGAPESVGPGLQTGEVIPFGRR